MFKEDIDREDLYEDGRLYLGVSELRQATPVSTEKDDTYMGFLTPEDAIDAQCITGNMELGRYLVHELSGIAKYAEDIAAIALDLARLPDHDATYLKREILEQSDQIRDHNEHNDRADDVGTSLYQSTYGKLEHIAR